MIDIGPIAYSKDLYLLISVFYTITILLFWKANVKYFDKAPTRQPFLILFVLIHLLFAFDGGDYYHYNDYLLSKDMDNMERVYTYIAELANYNYLLFRLIIWGSALFLFRQTSKRFGINADKAVFILYLMFISLFSYARASLAMAVYFYGISFLCIPLKRNKVLSLLLGVGIVLLSIVFHKSMLFTALVSIMVFVPINRRGLILFLILFAFSTPLLNTLFNTFVTPAYIFDEDINERIAQLQSVTYGDSIIGFSRYEWIRRFLEYSTIVVPFLILTFRFAKLKLLSLNNPDIKLYKVTLGILLVAISSYMIQFGNFVIFYRYLYMAIIPLTILVVQERQYKVISNSLFKGILFLCLTYKYFSIFKLILSGA